MDRGQLFMLAITRILMCTNTATLETLQTIDNWKDLCKKDSTGADPTQVTFRLDLLLAVIVALYWMKCILLFRVTKTFGPMLKIIQLMTKDLAQFLIIWTLIMIIFTSIAQLVFGDLTAETKVTINGTEKTRGEFNFVNFDNFLDVAIMFFESALGNWDLGQYTGAKVG